MSRWLAKGVLSAVYWFAWMYAIGSTLGDRTVDGEIAAPWIAVPPAILIVITLGLYAILSFWWDRRRRSSSADTTA